MLYDVVKIDGNLKRSAYVYLSDQPKHGWYSAYPAYTKYIQLRKQELQKHCIHLHVNVLYSDRGPSGKICVQIYYYCIDNYILCKMYGVHHL